MDDKTTFGFLDLPVELRTMIYDLALTSSRRFIARPMPRPRSAEHGKEDRKPETVHATADVALFLVNRQISAEAQSSFFVRNTIVLGPSTGLYSLQDPRLRARKKGLSPNLSRFGTIQIRYDFWEETPYGSCGEAMKRLLEAFAARIIFPDRDIESNTCLVLISLPVFIDRQFHRRSVTILHDLWADMIDGLRSAVKEYHWAQSWVRQLFAVIDNSALTKHNMLRMPKPEDGFSMLTTGISLCFVRASEGSGKKNVARRMPTECVDVDELRSFMTENWEAIKALLGK